MIAVEGFETARLRAEPMGPEHREGLIAMLGDERVGATLGEAIPGLHALFAPEPSSTLAAVSESA